MKFNSKSVLAALLGAVAFLTALFFIIPKPSDTLLEKMGSINSPKIGATLTFTSDDPGIVIKRRISGFDWGIVKSEMTASISPETWRNYPGFFAMIDEDGRFWAYNGKDQT